MNDRLFSDAAQLTVPLPLAELSRMLRSGELELAGFVERLCDRIAAVDAQLEALLPEPGRRERLLREAERLQQAFPDPAARPPLWGVPVGVKDIFHVAGFATRAGSALPPAVLAGPQSSAVTELQAAGAMVVGKTVTTEFAFFEPGPTRNPHNLSHTPGGSSSGSAAAVAAGLCALALGTQTIGSTIRPAAYCGIVGYKPSYGRIAADGLIPFSPSVDTVGLFSQDVAGMAQAAALLCADWQPAAGDALPVLGVPEGPYLEQLTPASRAVFDTHCALLAAAGYTLRSVRLLPDLERIAERHRRLIAAELAAVHAQWYARYGALYRPRTSALILEGRTVTAADAQAARNGRAELRAELEQAMRVNHVDLWIAPAAPGPAPLGLHATGDPALNLPWTHAGMPALTVPAVAEQQRLPLGLQLVAAFGADEQLLAWAPTLAAALQA